MRTAFLCYMYVSRCGASSMVNKTKILIIIMTCTHVHSPCTLEVCGYSIFATRPVPVAQDHYPYPYPTPTQNYYPTRPVPAGIPVPVTVKPSYAKATFLPG